MITAILLEPFALASPTLVLSALKALREVLLNCWMRFADAEGRWRGEVLRASVGIFKTLREGEDENEGTEEVKEEVGVVGRILVEAVRAGDSLTFTSFQNDIKSLVEVDAEIAQVFGAQNW